MMGVREEEEGAALTGLVWDGSFLDLRPQVLSDNPTYSTILVSRFQQPFSLLISSALVMACIISYEFPNILLRGQ